MSFGEPGNLDFDQTRSCCLLRVPSLIRIVRFEEPHQVTGTSLLEVRTIFVR